MFQSSESLLNRSLDSVYDIKVCYSIFLQAIKIIAIFLQLLI